MTMLRWVKLPTSWIRVKKGLREFRWTGGQGADNLAALMILMAIAHHVDQETGSGKLTYDLIADCTYLSRAKISGGLKVLEEREIIERHPSAQSSFQLTNYDPRANWGKLPALKLYSDGGHIAFFNELTLRNPVELNALKLYFLFVAVRNNDTNLAHISYDNIEIYTDIDRSRIKRAISILAASGVVHPERLPSLISDFAVANAYRLAHIEPYQHMGTMGRRLDAERLRDTQAG